MTMQCPIPGHLPPIAARLQHNRIVASRMPVRAIAAEVSAETGVPVALIYGRSRRAPIVRARWKVWAKARAQGLSLPQIGRATGHDHTTVLHGLRRLEADHLTPNNNDL